MKLLMFNINDALPAFENFEDPSLGLGYIKSYFDKYSKNNNISIRILKKNILETVLNEKPDIVGIASVTQDYTNAIKFAKKIKSTDSDCKIIIGGIHITNLPESFDKIFDLGVIGEGEVTITEVAEQIYDNGFNKTSLKDIKGLVFYDYADNLVITPRRGLFENLDSIPFPYRKDLGVRTLVTMLTSRGCPFKCAYCSSSSFWGQRIRYNSAEYVVDEMLELIINYKAEHITIWDDLFAVNVKRLSDIVTLIKRKPEYFKSVSFGVTARTDVINDEICKLLKEMNVQRVACGIESGSDRVLKRIRGGNVTCEINKKAIDILRKYNFAVHGGGIIGLPEETYEDMQATCDFMLNLKLDSGGTGLAVPYPNTQLWDYAKKRQIVSKDMDFSRLRLICDFTKLRETDDFILLSEEVTKKQVIDIGNSVNNYFFRQNVFSLFSPKTLNFKNICKVIKNPRTFLPFILGTFKRFFNVLIKR